MIWSYKSPHAFDFSAVLLGSEFTVPQGFPGGALVKNPPAKTGDARDTGSIPS